MSEIELKIVNKVKNTKTIPWVKLKDWEFNNLKDATRNVKNLKNSIVNDGFIAPFFVWDGHKYIIDGNGRNKALSELEKEGYEIGELPIVEIEAKTKQEAKAIVLKISSKYGNITNDSWLNFTVDLDVEAIKDTISIADINIEKLLQKQRGNTDPDEVPNMPKVAKSKIGDIYELGNHRLICGDSTNFKTIELLMAGETTGMVFTDPPYNVNYKGKGKNTKKGIMNDKMGDNEFDQFLDATFNNLKNFVGGGSGMYVFHSDKTATQFQLSLERCGFEIKNQLIWNKPGMVLGMGDYRSKHEPFFYTYLKGSRPEFYGDRTNATVWDLHKTDEELLKILKSERKAEENGKRSIWSISRDNVNTYVHPTQKPATLVLYAINNSSQPNDTVIDLFGGSGSTLIACEMANRQARICELDPKYVDVTIERWEAFTGEKAIKIN
jgi:DNA modification methylase